MTLAVAHSPDATGQAQMVPAVENCPCIRYPHIVTPVGETPTRKLNLPLTLTLTPTLTATLTLPQGSGIIKGRQRPARLGGKGLGKGDAEQNRLVIMRF